MSFWGCYLVKKDDKKAQAEKIVAEWIGKEIILPTDIGCTYLGRDTVCPENNTPYKVLVYTDSTGCTSCKLQLYKWNTFIQEAESEMARKVSFHFYFQPKDEKELKFLLRRDNFTQTVYIDNESKLNAINKIPDNISYQCFLLDKDNKVIIVGNPTLNPKIWDLYKQSITGKENTEQTNIRQTTVEAEHTEIELNDTKVQKTSIATFILKNTGEFPLLIKDISASCGCTVPEWDKKPIKPGDKTEIKVKVTPDATGYFRKTVTVFCNTKRGSIPLSVKSMVKG
ncbi:DUF1573 domain-containing protein [Dysgonomonas sp. Marseille-P4677]|uniref:DUF1573 domain-containing protein n=1 Tax=Dysgonomonas sp. Marseille-P4677 TaxID=2364790 RepID=UPI001912DCE7|nr:DUF1573 domain-containing protein [Dysgonomonas sp. Marseille-P4677]MBK5722165.1 DUF1573 domain-containing protein [Dysgonomonas sp. Marseille-P4677]